MENPCTKGYFRKIPTFEGVEVAIFVAQQEADNTPSVTEIDNNDVENAIRPTAVGKKNWLFIGDAEAGERSAILFTIIEACRSRGIDPQTYLREVLTRLPTLTNRQIKDVTPDASSKARKTIARRQVA
jgi:transposase